MMRSSNTKAQGKAEDTNSDPPLENGLPPKEDDDEENVRELAAKVVDDVVKRASEAAQQRTTNDPVPTKNKGCNLQRLPTIQIDTVPSAPSSPVDWTPPDENAEEPSEEEPLNESDIQLELDATEQEPKGSVEDLREYIKSYIEDILSQAMVLAEKKLQFVGVPEDEELADEPRAGPSDEDPPQCSSSSYFRPEVEETDDTEIRAAAEKVVEEVISKASETAAHKLENGVAPGLSFPGLPSIQIDTVKSAPPSPESEEEFEQPQKKWRFTMDDEDSDSEKKTETTPKKLIKFDEAPEEVQEAASRFVKQIVGTAVDMAGEKITPVIPLYFEADPIKTSGPWYIRAREALIRLLRTACFCTPRRVDS